MKPHELDPIAFTTRYRLTFNATQERPESVPMLYRHVKHTLGKAAYKAREGFVTSNADLREAKKALRTDAFLMSCRGMQSGELRYRAIQAARDVYRDRCDVFCREVV